MNIPHALALTVLAIPFSAIDALAQIVDRTGEFLFLPSAQVGGSIHGLAVAGSGLVYTADSSNTLTETDLRTGAQRTVLSGLPLSAPGQLLFGDGRSLVGTDLVLADWNTEISSACCDGRVLRIDPVSGAFTALASGNPAFSSVGDPGGVALGPGGAFGDYLYVMDFEGASPNPPVLYRVDAAGTATTFLIDPAQWTISTAPHHLAFGSAAFGGDLFVSDRTSSKIWRVDPAATLTPFVNGYSAFALAAASGPLWGDQLYFLAQDGSNIDLLRVDPAGMVERVVDDIAPASAAGGAMAFRPDGKALQVGVGGRIYTVLPATLQLQIAPNPVTAGQTLVVDTSGGVPGKPALLVGDRLLALRFSPPAIVFSGGFDASGDWTVAFPMPPGLAGIDVRVQTLSLDGADHYVASQKVVVQMQ
ncbi:MAG: hypothetical protein KDE27_15205 [Planctomycetes bacterium]|nr:hypothetical protein [Planctomycetota bacterium]